MAGLDCEVAMSGVDDASSRAELLLLSPSFLVPCLTHEEALSTAPEQEDGRFRVPRIVEG